MADRSGAKPELLAQESAIADAPEARFECPICLNWLRDPVLTSCGHRFCRRCIQPWLERENPTCPVDNMRLQKDLDIFPDNFTRREISQRRARCPNAARGCPAELSPLDVEAHVAAACEYGPPRLPACERLRCAFVECGCDEQFEDEPERQRHAEREMQKHLTLMLQTLSKSIINNPAANSASALAQQANFWDPPSKSDEDPRTNAAFASGDSTEALLKSLYEKIVVLEQKTREQDIIIANMSDQIAAAASAASAYPLRYCDGSYVWRVADVKKKVKAMQEHPHTMFYSPGFYTSPNGYKLCVRLNLSTRDNSSIAILIHMLKSEHDNALDWPFSGRITISIIHPIHSNKKIKETMMTRPELDAFKKPLQEINTKGFGYTEFASLEDILEQGYLDGNQLVIKVDVQPV